MYIQTIQDCYGAITDVRTVDGGMVDLDAINAFMEGINFRGEFNLLGGTPTTDNCVSAFSIMQGENFIGSVFIFSTMPVRSYSVTEEMPSAKELSEIGLSFNDVAKSYTLFVYDPNGRLAGYCRIGNVVFSTAVIEDYYSKTTNARAIREILLSVISKLGNVDTLTGYAHDGVVAPLVELGAFFKDFPDITVETCAGYEGQFRISLPALEKRI